MSGRYSGIEGLAGMAMLMAMSGAPLPRKSRRCTYRHPAGPPHPTTRQQLRALQRLSGKAMEKLS